MSETFYPPEDVAAHSAELASLADLVRDGCQGLIAMPDEDWLFLCDEVTYQIARRLAKDHRMLLPSIGLIEIVHDESGDYGRVTLAEAARHV